MYDVGCKKSDRIWEAERMKNYKRSGAAGFLCAAALFLGTDRKSTRLNSSH